MPTLVSVIVFLFTLVITYLLGFGNGRRSAFLEGEEEWRRVSDYNLRKGADQSAGPTTGGIGLAQEAFADWCSTKAGVPKVHGIREERS